MIQATDNDLLRALGAQTQSSQSLQGAPPAPLQTRTADVKPVAQSDSSQVNLSDASRLLNALQSKDPAGHPVANALSRLMEQLTGQKVANISIGEQSLQASSFSMDTVEESLKVGSRSGLDYQYRSLHAEGEQISYSAKGAIELEDGTQLSFEFKLEMSRIYVEETRGRVQVDGAALGDIIGADQPGRRVRPRENGMDIDLDHRGVRRLLEGLDEPGDQHGRHGRAHRAEDEHGHRHGPEHGGHGDRDVNSRRVREVELAA